MPCTLVLLKEKTSVPRMTNETKFNVNSSLNQILFLYVQNGRRKKVIAFFIIKHINHMQTCKAIVNQMLCRRKAILSGFFFMFLLLFSHPSPMSLSAKVI